MAPAHSQLKAPEAVPAISHQISIPAVLSYSVAAGLALALLTDQGLAIILGLVFLASTLNLAQRPWQGFQPLDWAFLALLLLYPILAFLQTILRTEYDWRHFDIPSRFILFAPIYILFRQD